MGRFFYVQISSLATLGGLITDNVGIKIMPTFLNTNYGWYTMRKVPGGTVPISGEEMVRLYERQGWVVLRQKGSHVQMGKGHERETIPLHRELKYGLEKKLLKRLNLGKRCV